MLKIVGHVVKSLRLSQVDEDAGGALAVPVAADAAVAEAPADRTTPVRVHESLRHVLPVPSPQAGAAELATDPNTVSAPADRLGVHCFLSALVTTCPQRRVVFLSPSVVDLLQHGFGDIFGHEVSLVRIQFPLAWIRPLLFNLHLNICLKSNENYFYFFNNYLVSCLIVFFVVIAVFLGESELPLFIVPLLTPKLFFFQSAFRHLRQPRGFA